jgi:hypothetical protein
MLAPSVLYFFFLRQCSPQHGEDEGPVRHGAPQDAAPFLQESPGEALLFTYVRSAILVPYLLFCELGRTFMKTSDPLCTLQIAVDF